MTKIINPYYVPIALAFLAVSGVLSKEDLDLYLIDRPKIEEVLVKYSYYIKRYRKKVVVNYLWNILKKYPEVDVLKRLRLIALDMAEIGKKPLKAYTPFLVEIAAYLEKIARENGVIDSRLEKAFDDLYKAISKENFTSSEIVSALARLYVLVESAMSVRGIGRVPQVPAQGGGVNVVQPSPPLVGSAGARAVKVREIKDNKIRVDSSVKDELIVDLLKLVKKLEEKGENTISKIVTTFYSQKADILDNMSSAYSVYKECIARKYLKLDKNRRVYLTDAGRKLLESE